jgi:hypothetical protein
LNSTDLTTAIGFVAYFPFRKELKFLIKTIGRPERGRERERERERKITLPHCECKDKLVNLLLIRMKIQDPQGRTLLLQGGLYQALLP